MNSLIAYFSDLPDWHRIALLTATVALFWQLETRHHWQFSYPRWRHALLNARFTLVDALVQGLLGITLLIDLNWVEAHRWGLVRLLPVAAHPLVQFALVFLLLDLLEYVYHVCMHRYGSLWRFHAVHHSDRHVDVSTVLREHPAETLIRLSFLLVWVFISGTPFWALMARQVIQIVANVIAHANLRLPEKLDRVVSCVFVTPNVHQVHHHERQPYTDSNYGDVLSIWDRLFGTYRHLPADAVVFGVDTLPEPADGATFGQLLRQPFGHGPDATDDDPIPALPMLHDPVNSVDLTPHPAR